MRWAVFAFAIIALSPDARAQNAAITKRACDGGDASACATLGDLYESGAGGLTVDYDSTRG